MLSALLFTTSSLWAETPPDPSILSSHPVGLLGHRAVPDANGLTPKRGDLRLFDFQTKTELAHQGFDGPNFDIRSTEPHCDGHNVYFLAPVSPNGGIGQWRFDGSGAITYKQIALQGKRFLRYAYIRIPQGFLFASSFSSRYGLAPTLVQIDDLGNEVKRLPCGGKEIEGNPQDPNCLDFDPKTYSFMLGCDGFWGANVPNVFASYTYMGDFSGHIQHVNKRTLGIALLDGKLETWMHLGGDGVVRRYRRFHSKRFRLLAGTGKLPKVFFGLNGYDQAHKSFYGGATVGRDQVLAWVSLINPLRPTVKYIPVPGYQYQSITTFSSSDWIACSVDRYPYSTSYVVWFKKRPSGEPVFKFTTYLEEGDVFEGLTDANHTAAQHA